ncbi:MAG: hypothetical protein E6G21_00550 [Actinobacteria bacterium]|nr:MAG: hypothetical protein E6G21_00550 [Actinomycetota bacterium]
MRVGCAAALVDHRPAEVRRLPRRLREDPQQEGAAGTADLERGRRSRLRLPRVRHDGRGADPLRRRHGRGDAAPRAARGGTLVLGLWIVAHGYVTPGGGFQGGVVLAAAFLLVWLAGSYRAYRGLARAPFVELAEGSGAGGYVVIGLCALLIGDAFLHNLLPYGVAGKLSSGGSIPLLNWASGLEVTAAFVLLFNEFLSERAVLIDPTRRPS